ncbi:MAG: hypothetical protein ACOZIN_14845 [Myxococcota bacterium]
MEIKPPRRPGATRAQAKTAKVEAAPAATPQRAELLFSVVGAAGTPLSTEQAQALTASVAPDALWGELPKTPEVERLERRLNHTHQELLQLEAQIGSVKARLEKIYDGSQTELQAEVIHALAHDEKLDPKVRRSMARYARLLARLEQEKGHAHSRKDLSKVKNKMATVCQRAKKRANDQGAGVELAQKVEQKIGADTQPGSLTSLLFRWFDSWNVFLKLFDQLRNQAEPFHLDPVEFAAKQFKLANEVHAEVLRKELARKAEHLRALALKTASAR